jgi:hypothetical protein
MLINREERIEKAQARLDKVATFDLILNAKVRERCAEIKKALRFRVEL